MRQAFTFLIFVVLSLPINLAGAQEIASDASGPIKVELPEGIGFISIWVAIALLGIWTCVGVSYRNSRTNVQQFDRIIALLEEARERRKN